MNWETGIDMHTLFILRIKQLIRTYCITEHENSSMPCGDLNGKEIQKEGMYVNRQLIDFAIQ